MAARLLPAILLSISLATAADVRVVVEADSGRRPISPWLFGRNNNLSDDPADPTSDSALSIYREAGLRILRENGGNNATKYNWRRKLSSHPDWYNNVYQHDWDHSASTLQAKLPGTQGLYALQLLGWAARTDSANFDCWTFDQCAGGSAASNKAGGGDPSRYLEAWPADSSVGILASWFGPGGKGLDSTRFRYWSMDNEPEIWNATHDDVTDTMSFEDYFQKYLAVAKAARAKQPSIRLVGPVFANEWMWWTWNNNTIDDSGTARSPMEMFLKRIGEEERRSGVRLLDVFDLHFYPGYNKTTDAQSLMQSHRMFFDTTYAWPGSNGIHMFDGKWNKAVPNYLFERVRRWMVTWLGEERGVAMTEFGAMSAGGDIDARDVAYASWIGSFADHGGEILTAWDWYPGWWEVLHLWSRNSRAIRVDSRSSLDSLVSAYSSISAGGDSLTAIVVNRDPTTAKSVTLRFAGFQADPTAATLRLSGLTGETFRSHAANALITGSAAIAGDSTTLSIPAKGIVALLLSGKGKAASVPREPPTRALSVRWHQGVLVAFPTKAGESIRIVEPDGRVSSRTIAQEGSTSLDAEHLPPGLHFVHVGSRVLPILRSP